tara:strand:+ start:27453 stop:27797 length:345 start_codon:yes stop_codon:yes gene_type:complete
MIQWLKGLFVNKNYKLQTFTYYIPAPPPRENGYREKQFDKLFYEFINKGYEVVDLKTQTNTGKNSQGMWIIALVRATNKESSALNLDMDRSFLNKELEVELEGEKVEGLYHLKD